MSRVGWREMSAAEMAAARALRPGAVRYSPGCFDKRYARSLAQMAESTEPEITDKQAALLPVMLRRYRRQVPQWEQLVSMLEGAGMNPRELHDLIADADLPWPIGGGSGEESDQAFVERMREASHQPWFRPQVYIAPADLARLCDLAERAAHAEAEYRLMVQQYDQMVPAVTLEREGKPTSRTEAEEHARRWYESEEKRREGQPKPPGPERAPGLPPGRRGA